MKHRFRITIFLIFFGIISYAQSFEIAMGTGAGWGYTQESSKINTDAAISLFATLQYNLKDSATYLKFKIHNMNTAFYGEDWKTGGDLDGEANNQSIFFSFGKQYYLKKWTLDYDFGLGFTREFVYPQKKYSVHTWQRQFSSVLMQMGISYCIGKKIKLRLNPVLFWADPINSLRYLSQKPEDNKWLVFGEDVHFLFEIGFVYEL